MKVVNGFNNEQLANLHKTLTASELFGKLESPVKIS